MMEKNDIFYNHVEVELIKAIDKHGLQLDVTLFKQVTIALEELGESAKAILDDDLGHALEELAQTGAMIKKLYLMVLSKIRLNKLINERKKGVYEKQSPGIKQKEIKS